MPGQWEMSTQVFFTRATGTVDWSYATTGTANTQVDLNNDFGVPGHDTLVEYSVRYQMRPSWSLHYSILPFESRGGLTTESSFDFGGWNIPSGSAVQTLWQFAYHRVGIMYHPISTPFSLVSVFNYWVFNDQRLRLDSDICGGVQNTVDRERSMIMSGIEVQKCIRTLPNAATLSSDSRIGLGYLDDTFLVDFQAALQFSVPMNVGRRGYAKGGYRLIQVNEDRSGLRLDSNLEGGFVEFGLIF